MNTRALRPASFLNVPATAMTYNENPRRELQDHRSVWQAHLGQADRLQSELAAYAPILAFPARHLVKNRRYGCRHQKT